jgi:ribosome-associated toxin RatA of RatAB toxin-antitoxin module
VERYSEFLPWCGGSEVLEANETEMEASITIRLAGLEQRLTTRNRMQPGKSIEMELLDGPFDYLHGEWRFTPLADQGCKVALELQFQLKAGLASAIIAPAFSKIANTMVDSFCARARYLNER